MYQRSLFSNMAEKSGKFLGAGIMAQVWLMSDGRVCKVSTSRDGTLNWLEFCHIHTQAGTLMPMMPEVYQIVYLEDGYMVFMPKYEDGYAYPCENSPVGTVRNHENFQPVRDAYRAYLESLGKRINSDWEVFDDLHSGNVMMCIKRGWVITDPSASSYHDDLHINTFELH